MPITFIPKPGHVLMCNFDEPSFLRPEMQKHRHCVVVSPRYRRHAGCALIVPFSTVIPSPVEEFHHRIPANKYSFFRADFDVWAKADMLTHAAFHRLDRVIDNGRYCSPLLDDGDLRAIRACVLAALGMTELAKHLGVAEELAISLAPQKATAPPAEADGA